MLVLRRKVGDAIVVDGTIAVYVLAVEGDRIKMGVTAPPTMPIVRGELLTPKVELPLQAPAPGRGSTSQTPGSRSRQQGARPTACSSSEAEISPRSEGNACAKDGHKESLTGKQTTRKDER